MQQNSNLAPIGWLAPNAIFRFHSLLASIAMGTLLILLLSSAPALADGGATMTVTADWLRFFCGESMDVTYRYIPDEVDTPLMRGYSVRIVAPNGLTFEEGDILVNSPLPGVFDTFMIIENGEGDYTIDFTFLETGVGMSSPGVLFIITYRDQGIHIPTQVSIESGLFRTPENQEIVVDISDTAPLSVVCLAPLPPTLDPEPEFTPGITNTLSWSDESDVGAVEYNVMMSTDAGFSVIEDESGWITGLSYEFGGLSHDQQYFFMVHSRNFTELVSADSDIETTI